MHLRLLTKRHLPRLLTLIANMLSSQVVVVSMVTVKLSSSQWIQTAKRHSSSNPQLLVVLFLRNISQQLVKVSRKLLRLVFLVDTRYLVFMQMYTMVHTMKSIHQKWHSISPVLWLSRMLWLRQIQFFWSLS